MKQKKLTAVHLLNDFSGSPFVLRQSLELLVKAGYEVDLFTATPSGNGFLSNIDGVKEHALFYKWNKNRYITLFLFLYSQVNLFFRILFHVKRGESVYINSLLPFGAAMAAKLRGCRILYHIHEVSIKPALLKKFLLFVANQTAERGIFVSGDLRSRTSFKKESAVIYNTLPPAFIRQAVQEQAPATKRFQVLMLCSLKRYKGVDAFIACAKRLPEYSFRLVLNASEAEIKNYFKDMEVPSNAELLPAQKDVHAFYREASVVMNLSLPDQWVETFGMTILEAMFYKIPVIVPTVGGVTELVTDEAEGYRISAYDINELVQKLQLLESCPSLYRKMSMQAFKKAQQFGPQQFSQQLLGQVEAVSAIEKSSQKKLAVQLRLF